MFELETEHWVMAVHSNPDGNLFGGQTLSWIDENSAILSRQITGKRCVTIKVENVIFHKPIKVGSMIKLKTQVISYGNTSLRLETKIYDLTDTKNDNIVSAEGIFKMVALDENGEPTNQWKHGGYI